MTPEKWRERYSSSSSHETLDSISKNEVNGSENGSYTSSPCAAGSAQEERKSRVTKRVLSSDSERERDKGLPDYVTFVPDTPTTSDSNQSPFLYSNTYPTTTTTTCATATKYTSSNSSGASRNSTTAYSSVTENDNSSGASRNSTTVHSSITGDAKNSNSDVLSSSSDSYTDDPKQYIRRLLKQHHFTGNINTYQFWRILERASRRVEQTWSMTKCMDKLRIRKLVDDYVEAYINAWKTAT